MPSRQSPCTNFNPRSPHGERRFQKACSSSPHGFQSTLSSRRATARGGLFIEDFDISIHALLTESDPHKADSPARVLISIHALLTESDEFRGEPLNLRSISIHALLTESDSFPGVNTSPSPDFNPRSPHGERPCGGEIATKGAAISIHALLTESDFMRVILMLRFYHFNPRSPHGERQQIPPNWPYRFCLKCQF